MGKRSDFERKPRDLYETPLEAAQPLFAHLPDKFEYIEPCAGDGALVRHLQSAGGICTQASDIVPLNENVMELDFFDNKSFDNMVITNPPWDRKFLHPMLDHFKETNTSAWLLFDADWMHTKQSASYMKYCEKIVSIGRVKWFPDTKMTGKDNCCWYLFRPYEVKETHFFGR